MNQYIFPQQEGQNLVITCSYTDGGSGRMTIRPERGALFAKKMDDGRKIEALSLDTLGGFLALVEYKIDGQHISRKGQVSPYTRVDLDFSGKVLDVFDSHESQFFLDHIGTIRECLIACANFVRETRMSARPQSPKLG